MIQTRGLESSPEAIASGRSLFFALKPDPGAARDICRLAGKLRERHGLTGRTVAPERLHVSLNSLGRHVAWPAETIARAKAVVSMVRMPAFVVAFNRVASFGQGSGLRPLVLVGDEGVIGVFALHHAIHAALLEARILGRREHSIEPHVTLLRDERAAPDQAVTPVRWAVREVLLIHSLRGEGRHETLGRWPLLGR